MPDGWEDAIPVFTAKDGNVASRAASGVVINAIARKIPELMGGSADLASSTNTIIKGEPNHWSIRGGNAQSGGVSTFYNGPRPNVAGYNPMRKEGAILLGIGGDNSNSSGRMPCSRVTANRNRVRIRPTSRQRTIDRSG